MFVIDVARGDDRPVLLALGGAFARQLTLFHPDEASLAATLDELLANPRGIVLVARTAEAVVGFLAGVLSPITFQRSCCIAQEVAWYVCPQARGASVGEQLCDAFETWARTHGAVAVCLSTLKDKPHGVALFMARGYVAYETQYMKKL